MQESRLIIAASEVERRRSSGQGAAMTTAADWEYCKLMKRGVSLGRQQLSL